jgi:hypothetical protein
MQQGKRKKEKKKGSITWKSKEESSPSEKRNVIKKIRV